MVRVKRPISNISILHYAKLVFRSILFLTATTIYIINKIKQSAYPLKNIDDKPILIWIIWCVFAVEIVLRFFPSGFESMGCQKQFARNYIPVQGNKSAPSVAKPTALVAVIWIAFNLIFGVLYFAHIIDKEILMLLCLAFSVCDMICILFFCPFQTWFMKNKCCGSCRIYNWDYAMMFTPLVFIKGIHTWSMLALSLLLLLRWELSFYFFPERFSETTNAALSCANCPEKLCHHKKQLQSFLKSNKHLLHLSDSVISVQNKLKRHEKINKS